METQLLEYENTREQTLKAASASLKSLAHLNADNHEHVAKIVAEDLPDASLPAEHQLEFCLRKITDLSKICLEQASKISSMQNLNDSYRKELTEAKAELRKIRQEAAHLQLKLTENDIDPYRKKLEG